MTVNPAAEDLVPGFYYGIAATDDLSAMSSAAPANGTWKQATSAGIAGGLTATKPEGYRAFFKVKVSETNPNK